jgi:hypothetical protein
MTNSSPFTLSIEQPLSTDQYGYHLGTDEKLARQIILEKMQARIKYNMPVISMALMRDRKIVDVLYRDCKWHSDDNYDAWVENQ